MASPPVTEDEIANAAGECHFYLFVPLYLIDLEMVDCNDVFCSRSSCFRVHTSFSPFLPLIFSLSLSPHFASLSLSLILSGMGDVHDGVNFMRAACVIAVEKAKASFEPMLEVQTVPNVVSISHYALS
jgi:hypothetical protein